MATKFKVNVNGDGTVIVGDYTTVTTVYTGERNNQKATEYQMTIYYGFNTNLSYCNLYIHYIQMRIQCS
jgi:hypothetical protein